MKVYVVFYYHNNRCEGIYGTFKTDKAAFDAVDTLTDQGYRAAIQVFQLK